MNQLHAIAPYWDEGARTWVFERERRFARVEHLLARFAPVPITDDVA